MTRTTDFDLLDFGREALQTEAEAILKAAERLDENFVTAVNLILETKGKVITTGVGKSGIIARKIAGTMACSGIPALFLHAAEAQMVYNSLSQFKYHTTVETESFCYEKH